MSSNLKMPSRKLLTWLIVLTIILCISLFLQRNTDPEIPQMTPEVEHLAQNTVDKMMEFGKKRKWKDFSKLWVTEPERRAIRTAAATLGNFRAKLEIMGTNYGDEKAESIQVTVMTPTGLMGVITLKKVGTDWRIESITNI